MGAGGGGQRRRLRRHRERGIQTDRNGAGCGDRHHRSITSAAARRSSPPRTAPARSRHRPRATRRGLGADALMVLPPYFVKPGPDALVTTTAALPRHPAFRSCSGCAAVTRGVDVAGALGAHGRNRHLNFATSKRRARRRDRRSRRRYGCAATASAYFAVGAD